MREDPSSWPHRRSEYPLRANGLRQPTAARLNLDRYRQSLRPSVGDPGEFRWQELIVPREDLAAIPRSPILARHRYASRRRGRCNAAGRPHRWCLLRHRNDWGHRDGCRYEPSNEASKGSGCHRFEDRAAPRESAENRPGTPRSKARVQERCRSGSRRLTSSRESPTGQGTSDEREIF